MQPMADDMNIIALIYYQQYLSWQGVSGVLPTHVCETN